jgi:hypothetical protein
MAQTQNGSDSRSRFSDSPSSEIFNTKLTKIPTDRKLVVRWFANFEIFAGIHRFRTLLEGTMIEPLPIPVSIKLPDGTMSTPNPSKVLAAQEEHLKYETSKSKAWMALTEVSSEYILTLTEASRKANDIAAAWNIIKTEFQDNM